MERITTDDNPSPPKVVSNPAAAGLSRVQLLRQRFEQQVPQTSSSAHHAGWREDFKRVDVRSLRQRLFAEPDSRGRRPSSTQAEWHPEYQPVREAYSPHKTENEEQQHPPPLPPRDDSPALASSDHAGETTGKPVSDDEISSLAHTLQALGLFSSPSSSSSQQTHEGRH